MLKKGCYWVDGIFKTASSTQIKTRAFRGEFLKMVNTGSWKQMKRMAVINISCLGHHVFLDIEDSRDSEGKKKEAVCPTSQSHLPSLSEEKGSLVASPKLSFTFLQMGSVVILHSLLEIAS